jgi:hypothetical protein
MMSEAARSRHRLAHRNPAGRRQPDRPGRGRTAKAFHERLPLTGLILTRADGDGRGGAALSMRAVTGLPIKFLGTGEKVDGLEVFDARRSPAASWVRATSSPWSRRPPPSWIRPRPRPCRQEAGQGPVRP